MPYLGMSDGRKRERGGELKADLGRNRAKRGELERVKKKRDGERMRDGKMVPENEKGEREREREGGRQRGLARDTRVINILQSLGAD